MSADATIFAVISAVPAVVVLYLIWSQHHEHERWQRKCDQQDLLQEIQRELIAQQRVVLARCADLQRRLDSQHRVLKYLRRRLS